MPAPGEAICACITPPGLAAIGVIRISGCGAIGIVAQYFRPRSKLLNLPSHSVLKGVFHSRGGTPLDTVLCTVFRAPRSYTGEDCVELSCHGNPQILARVLECLLLEARLANPGEFTLRALQNGKLDLAQAEAVNDLINAPGEQAQAAALMQVRGLLSAHLAKLLDALTDARLRCELAIDFSDQDLPQIDLPDLDRRISGLLDQARALLSDGARGRYIRDGIKVCLAGSPNSGKSSLFNAFLNFNRAIVTPHPGTTRDYLEEMVSLQGYTLVLYDTAGLRDSTDAVEREGISRSLGLMRSADLVLYLLPPDQAVPADPLPEDLAARTLWLASKFDLVSAAGPADPARDGSAPELALPVSVLGEPGLEPLQQAILARFELSTAPLSRPLITNARHLAALSRAIDGLERALAALRAGSGFEFVAFDLISASKALEEILGIVSIDGLLERIFANFCIGK